MEFALYLGQRRNAGRKGIAGLRMPFNSSAHSKVCHLCLNLALPIKSYIRIADAGLSVFEQEFRRSTLSCVRAIVIKSGAGQDRFDPVRRRRASRPFLDAFRVCVIQADLDAKVRIRISHGDCACELKAGNQRKACSQA